MRVYTAVQLFEVALFGAIVIYALMATPDRHPSLAVGGAGLLVGKAILNILAPEGGSLLRRSVIGYGVGAALAIVGVLLVKRF